MVQVGGWNPFQREELKVPQDYEWLKELTKAGGGDSERRRVSADSPADLAPFNRMVDGWLLAVALGARFRSDPEPFAPAEHRFEYGSILHSDAAVIHFLHHVALAEMLETSEFENRREEAAYEVVENPSRVIALCNSLAARGFPHLRQMTETGSLPPLANLLRALNDEVAGSDEDSE